MIGIYAIHNIKTDKYYIGQSKDIEHRWKQHKSRLKNNKHENEHLQNSYNKYLFMYERTLKNKRIHSFLLIHVKYITINIYIK